MKRLDESGQMAVELAIVLPVLLVVMVIVLDCLAYLGECAKFDHVAAQVVLAQGASPASGGYSNKKRAKAVKKALEQQFEDVATSVSVKVNAGGGVPLWRTGTFTCTIRMAPWPFRSTSLSIFGLRVPTALKHSYKLTVETYTPGRLL